MPSKRQIVDSIIILSTRFKQSDDSRLDEDYLGFLVEQTRVSEIIKEYNVTGIIDQNWLVDFGIYDLTKVNIADDPIVDFCKCDIMKAQTPSVINLTALGEGNLDLGLKVISTCGNFHYQYYPLEMWKQIPKEHTRSKFKYYQRFGNNFYCNGLAKHLRFIGIPETTEGLMIKKTLPVLSGAIKTGTVYMVKGASGSITYNGVTYLPTQTFTGASGFTTFTGSIAQVFYNDYEVEMTENDPFPVSMHLAKQIAISILTTELQIEKQQVADVVNDSFDDAIKQ